jgi:hypothetical protein
VTNQMYFRDVAVNTVLVYAGVFSRESTYKRGTINNISKFQLYDGVSIPLVGLYRPLAFSVWLYERVTVFFAIQLD